MLKYDSPKFCQKFNDKKTISCSFFSMSSEEVQIGAGGASGEEKQEVKERLYKQIRRKWSEAGLAFRIGGPPPSEDGEEEDTKEIPVKKKKCGASRERRRMRRALERVMKDSEPTTTVEEEGKTEEENKPKRGEINCTCECEECKAVRELGKRGIRHIMAMWADIDAYMYSRPPPPPYYNMYGPPPPYYYMYGPPRHPFGFPW